MQAPLLRSLLFAPANHERRAAKAFTLGADAVILDLEDAVAVAEKPQARLQALERLAAPRGCAGYVRVNALSTAWGYGDVVAAVRACVDGIVLPKVETAQDLGTAEWLIETLEREHRLAIGQIDLIPLIESARGAVHIAAIAGAARRTRRFAFGAGDYTLDSGITWSRGEEELLPVRSSLVATSRAFGLEAPIDTPWVRLDDEQGLLASAGRAAGLGFQGKLCIHPGQVAAAHAAFSPSEASTARARAVVAAFDKAEAEGLASIQLNGQFIDYPIAIAARRLVARAEAIAAKEIAS